MTHIDTREAYAAVTWREWLDRNGFTALLYGDPLDMPAAFADQPWVPTEADRGAAWDFLIQLRSRVATQPLSLRSGSETAALESMSTLFELLRDIATRHAHSHHFATLTLRLLNAKVRPFTNEWHRRSKHGDLASVDVCVSFRARLSQVQTDLRTGARMLATIAGVVLDDDAVHVRRTDLGFIGEPVLLASMPPPSAPTPAGDLGWREVFGRELAEIRRRRRLRAGEPDTRDGPAEAIYDGVGLALSGGGIRSATFSLGVVTELARRGILEQVDYLSTVSGGGYFGAFVSSMLGSAPDPKTAVDATFGAQDAAEAQGPRALRNHSKYLVEGGVAMAAGVAAMIIHGIVTSLLLTAPVLIMLAFVLRLAPEWEKTADALMAGGALACFAGCIAMTLAQKQGSQAGETRGGYAMVGGVAALIVGAVTAGGFAGVDHAVTMSGWLAAALIAVGVAMLVLPMRDTLRRLLGVLVSLLLLALVWSFVAWLASDHSPANALGLAVIAIGAYAFANWAVDLNAASPHRYYRRRLADTFLLRHRGGCVEADVEQKLSALGANGAAPYHLICAAVNLPGSRNVELRGRRADFFVFSKHACGSPLTGYAPTQDWEERNRDLTLATAVAVSGAAAAPNMGTNDASRFRGLLALLNVRLSYWLRKPDADAALRPTRYFRHELFGMMHERLPHLCVSDGGHIENLAVYELLRRRCKFIVCIDGEADPLRAFGGLLTLVQLARIDLGVTIDPDLTNLRIDDAGRGRSHFEQFRIDYGVGDDGRRDMGLLLYVKASMTGNESEFLQRYRCENPDFPHESTAQQLYSERQFEAYRSLGEHIAGDLFREDLVGTWGRHQSIATWFSRLAEHLLAPRE